MSASAWPAIAAATQGDTAARLRFQVADGPRLRPAGSVARAHVAALACWADALSISDAAVTLRCAAAERTAFFTKANCQLRDAGLIVAWRDETYALPAMDDGSTLATLERAAARFWGSTTFGAHCNGYRADAHGRPSHLWIARRAFSKPTDPGLLDNLVGGGVPHGQSPAQTVVREGWEEAGLTPVQMQGLAAGRRFGVARDVPEGFQRETVSVFDLLLPPGVQPANQDGEVHSITLMPVAEALARAAAGEMTVDASLVTLDFALRHCLLPADAAAALARRATPLWQGMAQLPG